MELENYKKKIAPQLLTLPRKDPLCDRYLRGLGPSGFSIRTVDSLNIQTDQERITFALYPEGEIAKPPLLSRLAQAFRLGFLPMTCGPFLLSLVALKFWGYNFAFWPTALIFAALVGLHMASFGLNDYFDHMQGLDRIQFRKGSQVIQKGWLKATQVLLLSYVGIFLSLLCGVYLAFFRPMILIPLFLFILVVVIGFSWRGKNLRYLGLGDLVIGLCMGPLQSWVVALILSPHLMRHFFLLGLPLGLMVSIVFQLRQLESLFAERNLKTGSLVSRLGFDRAKFYIGVELYSLPVVWGLVLLMFGAHKLSLVGSILFLVMMQLPLQLTLKKSRSPLSSCLIGIGKKAILYEGILFLNMVINIYYLF